MTHDAILAAIDALADLEWKMLDDATRDWGQWPEVVEQWAKKLEGLL